MQKMQVRVNIYRRLYDSEQARGTETEEIV